MKFAYSLVVGRDPASIIIRCAPSRGYVFDTYLTTTADCDPQGFREHPSMLGYINEQRPEGDACEASHPWHCKKRRAASQALQSAGRLPGFCGGLNTTWRLLL